MKAAEMFSLKGRVALVTGASSGLGTQFAKALADNGAAVALVARRADRLKALKDEIEGKGGKAVAIEADVTDRAAMARAFDAAEKAFGTVTILVNNAGIAQSSAPRRRGDGGGMAQGARRRPRRGVLQRAGGARAACWRPRNRARSSTSPRCWASASPRASSPTPPPRPAVVQITKALGVELAFKGVRVNAIAPGWFVTEINDKYLTGEAGDDAQARDSDGPFRQGRRSRRRAAAAWRRTPAATSPAPPSSSTAARW